MLLRTGSQSGLVHRTAPVMVLMVLFTCTSTRLMCAELLLTPQSSIGPMLMFEEFVHLLPGLCQLAYGPNCYESEFVQLLSEHGVYK